MIALLSLCVWLYLFFAHGAFWRSRPQLSPAAPQEFPDVDIIVPARDEAETIKSAVASLLAQDYAGRFRVILVDDNSVDGTAALAGTAPKLLTLRLDSKPSGWSGKLWALAQGIAAGRSPVVLLTDADIVHAPTHLSTLVAKLSDSRLDLASEMVRLNCSSLPERALIPAFVYFFQMLYPFARVNDPRSKVAAAAGGTVLIRREALERIGGLEAIRHALIDDVALAKSVKRHGPIFLGHSALAESIRRYPAFADIWRMISRTAFTQLRHSALLLLLTIAALAVVWLVPPWVLIVGTGWRFDCALIACLLAGASYVPTLLRYRCSPLWAFALPLIAIFYMAATAASALRYWRGKGAIWKNRAYPP
ncbi:MAG TPA: glycosyltransferase [Steroidobacteraceae bacterium]|nr:glycosyltransferase [Steroidobacteraceae bacterium]